MIAPSKTFIASALAVLAAAGAVNGHGYMSDPAVTWLSTAGDVTQFIATIESSASGFSGSFNTDPTSNTASFTKAFASSKYSSLKEMVTDLGQLISTNGVTITCGLSDPSGTAQPLPETYVEWAHSSTEGFTASHEGPCEIWCDNTRVFQDDDCAAHYTTAPAQLKYDHDACLGSSQLTFYWLALHSSTWQVYINCAPLEATTSTGATSKYAVGSSSSSSNSTSTTTSAPATTTSAPATTTSAPETSTSADGSDDSDCGSLDIADDYDDDSDCGSLDLADDSDCGSLDIADDSDCGSLDLAGSDDEVAGDADNTTVEDDSDCGSLDLADDSDCGSLDLADDSDCGSLDLADDSDCGSLDLADEDYSGSTAGLDFSSVDLSGSSVAGTVEADA